MIEHSVFKIRKFVCETCRAQREALQWNYDPPPVCHGPMAEGSLGSGQSLQIITDDVPGGFTVENGFTTKQTFYSKQEHRAALASGMRNGVKVGPGGIRLGERGDCDAWR